MIAANLTVNNNLKWAYPLSLLLVLMMGAASIAGILYQNDLYPTEELRQTFVANDVVNLLLGLPILLGSMWLARKGKLVGLLFWPGALFYGLYNYFVYLFSVPFNVMFPIYLTIVTLCIYTTIGLVASINGDEVKQRLIGKVPERFSGGVLAGLGILFILRVIIVIVGALASDTAITRSELALLAADYILSGALIIGGLLLWRRQALGYVGGTGLLFQASMLFIGLIFVLLLQPLLTSAPFELIDVLVVFGMGFICFIPFAFFLRGVVRS